MPRLGQDESQKTFFYLLKILFKGFCESSTMRIELSKEQEQGFKLIQQLFKAAEFLPSKGPLDLVI